MNDYAVTNDFFGNTIKGTPDLGAVESNVLSVSGKVNAYETATVGGSKVVYVPFTAKNPTTVKQLRAGLTVGDGSVANVYRGSTKLTADAAIQADDVLRFEVEGTSNTPIEYTIAQKNAWNWVDEFKTATGVVWNSQKQNGADGDWTDITTFSTEYPMSKYNEYYARDSPATCRTCRQWELPAPGVRACWSTTRMRPAAPPSCGRPRRPAP